MGSICPARWRFVLTIPLATLLMNLVLQFPCVIAQQSASVSGRVTDQNAAAVSGAEVEIRDADTGVSRMTKTNGEGFYNFHALSPGRYLMTVRKQSFRTVSLDGIILNGGEKLSRDFVLNVGPLDASITVTADANNINRTGGDVGTVIERQMVENLPLNGRSIQSLLAITPGINPVPPGLANAGVNQQGQFAVNGQRGDANYFMVDGVGANTGSSAGVSLGQSGVGALPSTTAFGGFNGLVSVDALQEFRVSTSSFAPEYGRTPGGQVYLVTRSGTNSYHGNVFDYFRNTALDASDWFLNRAGEKGAQRQNDFGGVFGGPMIKDKLFFFLSYEGLRFTNTQAGTTYTFTQAAREMAAQVVNSASPLYSGYMAQILHAYPNPTVSKDGTVTLGNGTIAPASTPCTEDPLTCVAAYTSPFPSTSQLDSGSARIDYSLSGKLTIFGRYAHSPSNTVSRGSSVFINNTGIDIGSDSGTVGVTNLISKTTSNELRFNYARSSLIQTQTAPNFAGTLEHLFPAGFAQPIGYSLRDMQLSFQFLGLVPALNVSGGPTVDSRQRQFNIVDTLSTVRGLHSFKFGADSRIIDPNLNVPPYSLTPVFYLSTVTNTSQSGGPGPGPGPGPIPIPDPPSCLAPPFFPPFICGRALFVFTQRNSQQEFRIPNWSFFAQDTWRIEPRLTLTYGARYEINPAPRSRNGRPFFSLNNFDPVKCTTIPQIPSAVPYLCQVDVNPLGTAPYPTTWGNIAPRIGIAYQISQSPKWARVLRAGFGIFYDTAGSASAAAVGPFSPLAFRREGTQFPVPTSDAQYITPPPIQTNISPSSPYTSPAIAVAPDLKLPRTYQFNISLQQAFGSEQSVTVGYIGAAGRKLIASVTANPAVFVLNGQEPFLIQISPTFAGEGTNLTVFGNYASSDYHSLQVQFQRRFHRGLGATASYTWSHSLDDASNFNAGASFPFSLNRSSSDFDIRQVFTASMVYEVPTLFKSNKFIRTITGHWSVAPIYRFQTAPPVNVIAQSNFDGNILILQRPSVISGIPLYVYGAQCAAQNGGNPCPGGRGFNAAPVINLADSNGVLPHPECQGSTLTPTGPSIVGYGAFCIPSAIPGDPNMPQGNAGRNLLRGFSFQQLDLAIHREFPVGDRFRLRFEGDIFNIFNHPNFASPQNYLSLPGFGISRSMLNSSFGSGNASTGGGYNPLYSPGGPRSVQLALKFIF